MITLSIMVKTIILQKKRDSKSTHPKESGPDIVDEYKFWILFTIFIAGQIIALFVIYFSPLRLISKIYLYGILTCVWLLYLLILPVDKESQDIRRRIPKGPEKSFGKIPITENIRIFNYLISILAGLSIVLTIQITYNATNNLSVLSHEFAYYLMLTVGFFAVVIPFYHGASLLITTEYASGFSRRREIILDLVFLFVESAILVYLAKSILTLNRYILFLFVLFALDTFWLGIRHIPQFFVRNNSWCNVWLCINLTILIFFAGFFLMIYQDSSLYQSNRTWIGIMISAILVVRNIPDYWLCLDYYFPKNLKDDTVQKRIDKWMKIKSR